MEVTLNSGASPADSFWTAWDGQDAMCSLVAVYRATIQSGQEQINWYKNKVRPKRIGSQLCRFAAIVLLGLAALLPLVKAAGLGQGRPEQGQLQDSNARQIPFELGYVVAAIAAGFIAFDKYFGLSTGWIRYIRTQLALEGALDELRYDWLALLAKTQGANPTAEQVQAMIQRLRGFIVLVHAQTQQETEAWVMEFQSSLADLERAAKVRAQQQKPGRVEVTVSNAEAFDDGVCASLDGMEARPLEGKSCIFGTVSPGSHIVMAKGAKSGKTLQASEIVRVQPDSVVAVSLELPAA